MQFREILAPNPSDRESKLTTSMLVVASAIATPALIGYGLVKELSKDVVESKLTNTIQSEVKMFIGGPVKNFKIGPPRIYK